MAAPFARLQKSQEPVNQAINNGKEEVLKEEHKVIYDVFFERMKAYRDWNKLEELYPGQKGIFVFMCNEQDSILKSINEKDVNSFDEENFRQLLLSTFKEIRKQHLANYEINQILGINQILAKKENLTGDEIKQILAKKGNLIGDEIKQILAKKGNLTGDEVNQILAKKENLTSDKIAKCIDDARGTEAKDILIKFAGGLFGIDVDPKDISGSIKRGLLEKIPFFGDSKKEEDNQPALSDTQVVTTFLRKSLLPIVFALLSLSISSLIFGISSIALIIAVIVLLVAEVKVVKSLFSNDKEGTLYNTHKKDENILFYSSHGKEIVKQAIEHAAEVKKIEDEKNIQKWTDVIGEDISKILQKQQTNQTAPVIEQITGPQKEQSQQTQVDSKENSMSPTDRFSWAQREENNKQENKVGNVRT